MEAHRIRIAVIVLALGSLGAEYRTTNFHVQAPSAEVAKTVALTAERSRKQIARNWLGKTLPPWYKPCHVTVQTGRIGAGGRTSFQFDRGHVFGWRMRVQGTLERILDSVIPHEVSHTIFACHFRRPLPRWADEGAATLVEHESEQRRQRRLLEQVLNTRRRIPLKRLLTMTEYPRSSRQVLVLYAEGYSLADFLVQSGGKARFLKFLHLAHRHGWEQAIRRHYPFHGIEELERQWTGWVTGGSPRLNLPEGTQLAEATDSQTRPQKPPDPDKLVIRSQSPDGSPAEAQQPTSPLSNGDPANERSSHASHESQPDSEVLASTDDRRGEGRPVNDNWEPIPLPRSQPAGTNDGRSLPRQRLTHPVLTVPYKRPRESSGDQQPRLPSPSTDAAEFPRARSAQGPRRPPPDGSRPDGARWSGRSPGRSLFPERVD